MPRTKLVQKEKRKRGRPPKKKKAEAPAQEGFLPELEVKQKPELKVKKDAPESQCFMLCNGKPVKNIKELADIMEELEEHVFNFHVTPEKNDFATWVKDIFQDVELAEKLAGIKDKKHMQLVLYRHISHKLW